MNHAECQSTRATSTARCARAIRTRAATIMRANILNRVNASKRNASASKKMNSGDHGLSKMTDN